MMKYLTMAAAVVGAVCAGAGPAMAGDNFGARLRGLEEATPNAISTGGQGFLNMTLNDAETQLDYQLFYRDLESNVTQAHIHFGMPSTAGGVVLFFCSNLAPPANVPVPPPCPNGSGFQAVTGSLTAANVGGGAAGQGIAAGEFAKVIRALKSGATYANVHTTTYGSGEIRGQITR